MAGELSTETQTTEEVSSGLWHTREQGSHSMPHSAGPTQGLTPATAWRKGNLATAAYRRPGPERVFSTQVSYTLLRMPLRHGTTAP